MKRRNALLLATSCIAICLFAAGCSSEQEPVKPTPEVIKQMEGDLSKLTPEQKAKMEEMLNKNNKK